MAERSGETRLDALIEAFIRRGIWHESVPDWLDGGNMEIAQSLDLLRTPRGARNKCVAVTGEFNRFLRTEGYPIRQADDDHLELITPDELGYADRTIYGYNAHTLTITEVFGIPVSIDWAAAQYGYHEFPLVQFRIGKRWQREIAVAFMAS